MGTLISLAITFLVNWEMTRWCGAHALRLQFSSLFNCVQVAKEKVCGLGMWINDA